MTEVGWNDRKAGMYLGGGMALLTFAVYAASLRNDFVLWDDDLYVYENPFIRSWGMDFLTWAFTSFYAGNWHPLTWVSHALDYSLWGLNPLGHHLTNTLLHAVNTLLVVLLCVELQRRRRGRAAGHRSVLIAAGVAGALFGLHPLHVESVAWVSERKDLLCALFYLLSVMAYVSSMRTVPEGFPVPGGAARPAWKLWLLSLFFFFLALLSKPMAVSLPVVLLILDWHVFNRIASPASFLSACMEKLPFIALSAASSLLTILAQSTTIAPLEVVSLPTRLLVALQALMAYLGKMAMPVSLLPFYPYPDNADLFSAEYAAACLMFCMITGFCIVRANRNSAWIAVWGYYCITLVPVIGIVTVGEQSMADRYTYLPSIGPFLLLGLGAARLENSIRPVRHLPAVLAVVLAVSLSWLTVHQISHWRNSIDLWTYVIQHGSRPLPLAYSNRGLFFMKAGQVDRALRDFDRAIALDPGYVRAYANRGQLFKKIGWLDRAFSDYDRAIAIDPRYPVPYNSRGVLFGETGRLDRALADFNTVIALNPGHVQAYINRGITLHEAGRMDEALESFASAIAVSPFSPEAYNGRGAVQSAAGRFGPAMQDFTRAVELNPAYAVAYSNRANALSRIGLADKALADYNTGLSLDPELVPAYLGRGALHLKAGRIQAAAEDFLQACQRGSREGCSVSTKTAGLPGTGRPAQSR